MITPLEKINRIRMFLGSILLQHGLITQNQLDQALEYQKKNSNQRLGRILIELGFITEEELTKFLAEQFGISIVVLTHLSPNPEVLDIIPSEIAYRYNIIPIELKDNTLLLAMVDPLDIFAVNIVEWLTGYIVEPVVVSLPSTISAYLDQFYKFRTKTVVKAEIKNEDYEKNGLPVSLKEITEDSAPVVKLVNTLIERALKARASDIHIEPEDDALSVRFRIDGILHDEKPLPLDLHPAVTSRVKVMADLDIAEKRIPQDGRFQVKIDNRDIDLRISTLPTINGEKVVMRILDRKTVFYGLEEIGFSPDMLVQFESLIHRPHGIILVTGPTGSGKTTTLYAALSTINTRDKNIVTLEDPVEYQLKNINQIQAHHRIGLNFAKGLRAILRQDPDVIMVGEIRDLETAEIAVQAALTGHLVFSTLHTNDAPGAITRLMDMKVDPFLISSSIVGVLAQRLIRIICSDCKEAYTLTQEEIKKTKLSLQEENLTLWRGRGCGKCRETGYIGRIGIFELMKMSDEIRKLIMERTPSNIIRETARNAGMVTLQEDGLKKVKEGLSTIEEVSRVTQEEAEE